MYLLLIFFLLIQPLFATESKLVDGVIVFPKCQSGNTFFWTQAEADSYMAKFPTATVMAITPTPAEMAVSTSVEKFENYSEFKRLTTDTTYYNKKKLRQDLGF